MSADRDSVVLLQEMFGYALSGDTSLQKIMLLVGPTRAGKGVIARVLTNLLGRHNVGAPTLAGLTTNFGLQDLIGKTLAIVSDARLGPKANVQSLAERLLSVRVVRADGSLLRELVLDADRDYQPRLHSSTMS